ncbi:ABC transporter substrate-binding protein [Actinophytocola sp.]|uniref:ABC transporter substrate-binding protein n=1 Tax=Actinophytocola sp. TaxID=1872138 RepID=UPI002D71BCC1|nr:ABC transporter substrate-binding protein [Actinophytocola sp.]HYQ62456.1 ABC transporter substrate-binding protein [Actinophytocola sp.]
MRQRPLRIVALLGAAVLALAGCGGGGSAETADSAYDPNAVFKYGVPAMPTSFDPRLASPLDPVFLDVVYESLIGRTPAGKFEPGLATKWTFSDDQKSLTLTLREGVTFHDGEAFDSAAVVTSMNALKKSGAQAGSLKTVAAVQAVGKYSVKIDFSQPSGYMLNVLAGEAGIVVAPKALDSPDLATKPVGTGAFTLTGLQQGKITFAKFDKYWDAKKTTIGGIEMTVFSDEPTRLRSVVSGEMDGTTISAGQKKEAEANGLSIVQGPNSQIMGVLLNTKASEFGNPLVRKALMYAVDRKAISDSLFDGGCAPTVQPFAEGFWPNDPKLNDVAKYHDVAKAKDLLKQAGLPNGFSFELVNGPNTTYENLSQVLQAQLKEVGITASVRTLEFSQILQNRRTGNFAAATSLLQVGRPDPSQFVADFYVPGGSYNAGGFTVAGVTDQLAKARASSDEKERQGPMREIVGDVFDAGPPMIPVCGVLWVGAFRQGVTGFQVPKFGDYDFASVKISG